MSQCLKPFAHPTTAPDSELPPRTSNVTTPAPAPRDIAAEIIDEYSPELSAAYRASRDAGKLWAYPDIALAAFAMQSMRQVAGR